MVHYLFDYYLVLIWDNTLLSLPRIHGVYNILHTIKYKKTILGWQKNNFKNKSHWICWKHLIINHQSSLAKNHKSNIDNSWSNCNTTSHIEYWHLCIFWLVKMAFKSIQYLSLQLLKMDVFKAQLNNSEAICCTESPGMNFVFNDYQTLLLLSCWGCSTKGMIVSRIWSIFLVHIPNK